MNFCDKLQKIRKENNITQEGLADKLNVSRQAVSKWENGGTYPDTEKLIQISKIFNVSLDELINDNVDKNVHNLSKKISFMELLNEMLEFISKSINMFWSMKFFEKIKCLFEMLVLILIIVCVAMLSTSIMVDLVRRILMFLPGEFLYWICNLFDTLLFFAWIVLGIIIVVKIFKNRYLDYYVFVTDDNVSEKTIEEPIKELKEKKEYKIVIRDPKDSSLNIIRKIGKVFTFLAKILCFLIVIPLVMFFVLCVLMLVFSLFYLFEGLFFNGISIAIVGVIFFIYLMIEFIYNLLFNREHAVNRIFMIFIGSISLIGIGLGLSFASLSNFTFEKNIVNDTNTHIIEMSNDLVITSMIYDMSSDDIIIDNSLDNIKLEVISYGEYDTHLYTYNSYDAGIGNYKVVDVSFNYNELDLYKSIIEGLKNEIIIDYDNAYNVKMYISENNLTKLRENINKYYGNIYFE